MHYMILASFSETAERFFNENLAQLIKNLSIAILIFIVGRWASGKVANITEKVMEKSKVDETIRKFLTRLVHIGLLTFVIISCLSKLGFETTNIAAILAAAGLAIGLALQSTLSNFACGVMLVLFKPYKVGDFVEISGTMGVVKEIHIFNTVIITGDNIIIYLPNSSVSGGKISNYSTNPTRRIDLVISCSYNDSLLDVKNCLNEIIDNHPQILKDPAPVIAVADLSEMGVNFFVRPWVKTADYWTVRWDLLEKIRLAFVEKGFKTPSRNIIIQENKTTVG
jgi:small conductance mechanosensitive channel